MQFTKKIASFNILKSNLKQNVSRGIVSFYILSLYSTQNTSLSKNQNGALWFTGGHIQFLKLDISLTNLTEQIIFQGSRFSIMKSHCEFIRMSVGLHPLLLKGPWTSLFKLLSIRYSEHYCYNQFSQFLYFLLILFNKILIWKYFTVDIEFKIHFFSYICSDISSFFFMRP